MSEKTYVFNDQPNNNGGSRGMDLVGMLNLGGGCNSGYGHGFGGEGGIWAILLLALLGRGGLGGYGGGYGACCDGGGYGGGNHIPEILAGDAGRELLMNAIQGNTNAISTLASSLNCSVQNIQTAICGIDKSICGVSKEIGMTGMQVINAVNCGDTALANQIAQCCCATQNAIITQGYQNQLANCEQTNKLMNAGTMNTLQLRDAGAANTREIVAKIDAFENQYRTDKYNTLLAQNTRLQTVIDLDNQQKCYNQTLNAYTAPLNEKLCKIEHEVEELICHEPPTYPQPYLPGTPIYPVNVYGGYGRCDRYDRRDRFDRCDDCCNDHNYNF